jgi:hypothetical protein
MEAPILPFNIFKSVILFFLLTHRLFFAEEQVDDGQIGENQKLFSPSDSAAVVVKVFPQETSEQQLLHKKNC